MSEVLKVLIVDDDQTILSLLDEVFRDDPTLRVQTLSDSVAAFDLLGTEEFDLLITDLMMPKIDGLRLLERAKELMPEILVVIVTGYASLETTLRAIHAGVYDYITKPFRVEEFRLLVHNAGDRIRLTRENRVLLARNAELEARLRASESDLDTQRTEVRALNDELGRRTDLEVQTGSAPGEPGVRGDVSSYGQRGIETSEERYDREIARLEDLFTSGSLTVNEFEISRQRLQVESQERGIAEAAKRYDREIVHLLDLFDAERLTSRAFDAVRQRVKTTT